MGVCICIEQFYGSVYSNMGSYRRPLNYPGLGPAQGALHDCAMCNAAVRLLPMTELAKIIESKSSQSQILVGLYIEALSQSQIGYIYCMVGRGKCWAVLQ